MKRIILPLMALLALPGIASAEYNPFSPKAAPAAQVAPQPVEPLSTATVQEPSDPRNSANLDEELKSLLLRLDQSDSQVKNDNVDFIATTNCVDIFYHNDTKTYEERTSKSCLKQATKDKINKELKSIKEKSKHDK